MRHLIVESKAYQALNSISKKIVDKREIRVQIEDAIVQARNMGIPEWKKQTPILPKHQNIVEEIVKNTPNGKN